MIKFDGSFLFANSFAIHRDSVVGLQEFYVERSNGETYDATITVITAGGEIITNEVFEDPEVTPIDAMRKLKAGIPF